MRKTQTILVKEDDKVNSVRYRHFDGDRVTEILYVSRSLFKGQHPPKRLVMTLQEDE